MLTPFIMKTSYFSFFFIHLWCPSLCSVCMNHGRKCVSLFAQVSWETTFLQNLFPGSMEEAMKGKIWREIRVLVVRNRGPYIGGPWAGWRIQNEKVWIPLRLSYYYVHDGNRKSWYQRGKINMTEKNRKLFWFLSFSEKNAWHWQRFARFLSPKRRRWPLTLKVGEIVDSNS